MLEAEPHRASLALALDQVPHGAPEVGAFLVRENRSASRCRKRGGLPPVGHDTPSRTPRLADG